MKPEGLSAHYFPFENRIIDQLLAASDHVPAYCFLQTCPGTSDAYGSYDWICGWAHAPEWLSHERAIKSANLKGEWLFGILSYEYKNQVEPHLSTAHPDPVGGVHPVQFFRPEVIIGKEKDQDRIFVIAENPEQEMEWLRDQRKPSAHIEIRERVSQFFDKGSYIKTVEELRDHIREGDVYEINLTQEFRIAGSAHPSHLFQKLTSISPVPFAAMFRANDTWLISASPERFLQLKDGVLLTQPIKGTISRGKDKQEDLLHAETLRQSSKDRSENVMIVDLSRNDLNRSAITGTVEVPGLFEVQSFAKVHHLVSTIRAQKRDEISAVQAIRNAFPPGSMTGAPKVRAMELIDQYERSARGIYSGSVGYFSPKGDFDLNVIIRSLIYDQQQEIFSWHVGGAITWESDPEGEYEETLVKARAIMELFGLDQGSLE